jgi:hypothetical protein
MLRRIFGQKRNEVTEGWKKLYNEELHNLYSSSDIIRMIKLRRFRWEGHVARMGEKRHKLPLVVMLVTCIWKATNLNLSQDSEYPDRGFCCFCESLQANAWIIP